MTVTNPSLEEIVKIADESSSRQLVAKAVRAAYALGKHDAIIELMQRFDEVEKAAREKSRLIS